MRVALDASVLIAAFLSETGASRALFRHAQARTFQLVLSPAILDEVRRNLRRLDVATETVGEFTDLLQSIAVVVRPGRLVPRVVREHPPDDHILACAVTGAAAVLVTLDRRHLLPIKVHRGVPIRLPRDVLRSLPSLST